MMTDQPTPKPIVVDELDCMKAKHANAMIANAILQITNLQTQQQNIQLQIEMAVRDRNTRQANAEAVRIELSEKYDIDFARQQVDWETGQITTPLAPPAPGMPPMRSGGPPLVPPPPAPSPPAPPEPPKEEPPEEKEPPADPEEDQGEEEPKPADSSTEGGE